jgi:hypothetical protein
MVYFIYGVFHLLVYLLTIILGQMVMFVILEVPSRAKNMNVGDTVGIEAFFLPLEGEGPRAAAG